MAVDIIRYRRPVHWVKPVGLFTENENGYKRINGKTFELYQTSRSKSKLQKKGKELKSGWLSGVSSYRVKRKGTKWGLYVR